MRLVDDHLVDADLRDGQHVVLAGREPFQLGFQLLLHVLDALAGDPVVAVHPLQQLRVDGDLGVHHALLELGRGGDELEGRVGDDDAVPVGRGGAGQEAGALLAGEVLLVGDQDAGGRVKLQELPAGLRQAVSRHHHHRLGNQPQAALLHDRRGERERLARPDCMRHVGRPGGDDAPDHPLLVAVEPDHRTGTGQLQVRAVEGARHQVVEPVVVQAGQPVGAVRVGPDPALERLLDPQQPLPGRLGLLLVQLADFLAVQPLRIPDLRGRAVQRILQQQPGVPARGAPLGGGRGGALEPAVVHRPDGGLHSVPDVGRNADHLGRERLDIPGRQPWPAQARGDVRRPQVLGLHLAQCLYVAEVARVDGRRCFRRGQLGADGSGQVGVRRLPHLDRAHAERRVEEHRAAQFRHHLLARLAQQLRHAVQVHAADLV